MGIQVVRRKIIHFLPLWSDKKRETFSRFVLSLVHQKKEGEVGEEGQS